MESEVFIVAIHYQKLTKTELPTFIDMDSAAAGKKEQRKTLT